MIIEDNERVDFDMDNLDDVDDFDFKQHTDRGDDPTKDNPETPDDEEEIVVPGDEEEDDPETPDGEEEEPETPDEEDDEDDETEEERAEREAEEAAKAKKAKARIPLTRHEEILGKHRDRAAALEARIAELEGKKATEAVETALTKMAEDLSAKEDEYEQLVVDGKLAEAKLVRIERDKIRDRISEVRADARARAVTAEAYERMQYTNVLERMEEAHPEINPDNEAYDETKVGEVQSLMQAFQAAGDSRADSLAKAVRYAFPEGPPAQKPAEEVDTAAAKAAREKRAAAAAAKKAAAKSSQPPDSRSVGKDVDKRKAKPIDVSRLTEASFDKLDEETLARARGDIL